MVIYYLPVCVLLDKEYNGDILFAALCVVT